MTPTRDPNNLPVTRVKDLELCSLPPQEFKIAVLRKLNKEATIKLKDNSMMSGKPYENKTRS